MEVFVIIREDQNDHGFVDTSVCGLYRNREEAEAHVKRSKATARTEGLNVCGDEPAGWEEEDWQVYFKIAQHDVK